MIDLAALKARDAAIHAFNAWDDAAAFGTGPLAGTTAGIKANIAVAGLPWTAGMGHRLDVIAAEDAPVVARLRAAGAAILGTLNMHEAALGATTANPFTGTTQNPHRIGHTPGGSSGGSGAAVAAGLCDLALGTDTLGSIRIPAAYNGVYGLKPTHGLIPDAAVVALEPAFDCVGPLARDLSAIERAMAAMAPSNDQRHELSRVLVLKDGGGVACELAVADAHARAVAAIGMPISEITLPAKASSIRLAGLVRCTGHLRAALGPLLERASPDLQRTIEAIEGKAIDTALIASVADWLVSVLGEDGLLVMPTTPHAPFAHGTPAPASQADFTALASLAGLPALAVPAGRDVLGLPVSVQLVGPARSEAALIALARRIEPALGGAIVPEPTP